MIVTGPITTISGNYDGRISVLQDSGILRRGQIIDAVTLSASKQGKVSLRIGEAVINASTNISFQKGANVSLEVVQLRPHLLLKLISQPVATTAAMALQNASVNWLPQQSGIAPVLAELIHRAMTGAQLQQQRTTQALVNALIHGLPGRNSLIRAEGVRQAVLQSGIFLESKLSRSVRKHRTGIKNDMKANLLRLRHVIERDLFSDCPDTHIRNIANSNLENAVDPPRRKGLPVLQARIPYANTPDTGDSSVYGPGMLSKLQGAIARLGLLQINTAQNHFNGEYSWQLEIPVQHSGSIETVSITIENEQKDLQHEDRNAWIVNLALELPQLGPIEIRISLYSQGVSSCFRSDSRSTLRLIESQLTQLKSSLEHHGIEALALCCQQGQAAAILPDPEVSIIDIQV